MPTSTVEDYLKAILVGEERATDGRVPSGEIAQVVGVTPGTATAMVKTLAESGLVDHEPYGGVRLTRAGRRLALAVLRRHRLVELFLVEVMGMDWSEVHPEAERLEHAVSERLVERIDAMLGHPSVDPHGDPIPSSRGAVARPSRPRLSEAIVGTPLRVTRIEDQSAEFLRWIDRIGLRPGSGIEVTSRDDAADSLVLRLESGAEAPLGLRAAARIVVEPG